MAERNLCGAKSGTYKHVAARIALDLADRQHHARAFLKLIFFPIDQRSIQYGARIEPDQTNGKRVAETGNATQHAREVEERPAAFDLDPFVGIQASPWIRNLTGVARSAAH
jgi:hypothetical protein